MKPKAVSLSGRTRLTYREAYALLTAALEGQADAEVRCSYEDDQSESAAQMRSLQLSIDKLKQSLSNAGGYRDDGTLIDPFA